MTPLHCQSEISGFAMVNFYLKDSVTRLSFIAVNDNTGESQIKKQKRKNVNKYTNIVIIPIIYCSHWFPIARYLKEKIIVCSDSLYKKIKVNVFERVLFIISFILNEIG